MSEAWERGEHPAQAEVEESRDRPRCPGCGLVMSDREAAEQGECNECHGGAWDGGAE